jgi:DNA-binding NarL/FixJ family response regulator
MKTATVVRLVSPSRQPAAPAWAVMPPSLRASGVVVSLERRPHALTAREREVLALLCQGMPNKLIQRHLGISFGTVKCHVRNILSKLGVASRVQAVIETHRRALLQSSPRALAAEAASEMSELRAQRA